MTWSDGFWLIWVFAFEKCWVAALSLHFGWCREVWWLLRICSAESEQLVSEPRLLWKGYEGLQSFVLIAAKYSRAMVSSYFTLSGLYYLVVLCSWKSPRNPSVHIIHMCMFLTVPRMIPTFGLIFGFTYLILETRKLFLIVRKICVGGRCYSACIIASLDWGLIDEWFFTSNLKRWHVLLMLRP